MPDWDVFSREVEVGAGALAADALAAALFSWELHRRAGLEVTGAPVGAGVRAVLVWRFGLLRIPAPVEVTDVIRDPGRSGFTYCALPGHPEEGEESFSVDLDAEGRVWFRITARSRPATWWASLGAVVARRVQRRITDGYLDAAVALGHEACGDRGDSG